MKTEEQGQLSPVECKEIEDEDELFEVIDKLAQGINAGDVKKLQDAGIYICNGLMMHTCNLNDFLSLGQHRIWKRMTVSWSGAKMGDSVLDLCCGSGDMCEEEGATHVYYPKFKRDDLGFIYIRNHVENMASGRLRRAAVDCAHQVLDLCSMI